LERAGNVRRVRSTNPVVPAAVPAAEARWLALLAALLGPLALLAQRRRRVSV
jgi:hypothetical protein